jgi:hypothetical protein
VELAEIQLKQNGCALKGSPTARNPVVPRFFPQISDCGKLEHSKKKKRKRIVIINVMRGL